MRYYSAMADKSGKRTPADEQLLQLFVDSVRDYAIFQLDAEGNVKTWNAAAERFKGYRPQEIIGRHFSQFYTSEDIASGKPEKHLRTAAETGRSEDVGWRLRKDGSRFWADVVITAIKDADGTLLGFAKITRDASDRREAEVALRRSEEHARMLFEYSPDAALVCDAKGQIMEANARVTALFGYERKQLLGKPIEV